MLRILFIGSLGIQSVETLKGLLASGQKVAVIALAGSTLGLPAAASWKRRYIPVIDGNAPNNIQHVAASEGIPFEILDPLDPGTRLRPHTPDIGVVSCFPHRLHENLLKLPAFGCYNLHPSLLPQYRGPTPLFWQLRQGETETGVTLHKMCAGIDTGDIVAQQRLLIDDGISELELGRRCAERCGACSLTAEKSAVWKSDADLPGRTTCQLLRLAWGTGLPALHRLDSAADF